MAQILVKAIDATHADPVKDRRGCYKRGMPVVVMPDSHTWGREECLPKFVLIKIPGASVDKVRKYLEPEREGTANADGIYPVYRRRLWKFRFDDMPAAARRRSPSGTTRTRRTASPRRSTRATTARRLPWM